MTKTISADISISGPRTTRRDIQRLVKEFLAELEHPAQTCPEDAEAVAHLCATFRQPWPRLFACYMWPKRWRTNNDLESFFGRLRTRQRQIYGRKFVHEFIICYGVWAIFIDPTGSFEQVLRRFQQFDQAKFDEEYALFSKHNSNFACNTAFGATLAAVSKTWNDNGMWPFTVNPANLPCRWNFAVAENNRLDTRTFPKYTPFHK